MLSRNKKITIFILVLCAPLVTLFLYLKLVPEIYSYPSFKTIECKTEQGVQRIDRILSKGPFGCFELKKGLPKGREVQLRRVKNKVTFEVVFPAFEASMLYGFSAIVNSDKVTTYLDIECNGENIYKNFKVDGPRRRVSFWLPKLCVNQYPMQMTIQTKNKGCNRWEGVEFFKVKTPFEAQTQRDRQLSGYTDQQLYHSGEKVVLKINAPSDKVKLSAIRWGESANVVETRVLTGLKRQSRDWNAFAEGANWEESYQFEVPSQWKEGVYTFQLEAEDQSLFHIPFVLQKRKKKQRSLLVVLPTNTWQAYNPWGGASFYKFGLKKCVHVDHVSKVHFSRPFINLNPKNRSGHLLGADLLILRWLDKNKYKYDIITDRELHEQKGVLGSYKTVILGSHSEYWTQEMYDQVEAFAEKGGNLLSFSGNAIYKKVTLKNGQMEVQDFSRQHLHTKEPGGLWRDLGRPEAGLLGVAYDARGYKTFAKYRVKTPNHWVFRGLNVQAGDLFGNSLNRKGASGHETDKTTKNSPKNITVLAVGENPKGGGAHMTIYQHRGGGWVFAAGSITFGGSLLVDPVSSGLVKNFLNH